MHKHHSFSQIMYSYSKNIYLAGPEKLSNSLTPSELKKFDQKLNQLTIGFNKINSQTVEKSIKDEIKNNLPNIITKFIKNSLHTNPAQAQQLFDTLYANKLNEMVLKATQKLNSLKFNIEQRNLGNIKIGARIRFVKGFKNECGIEVSDDSDDINMNETEIDKNLATQVYKNASGEKIRTAVKKAEQIATVSKKIASKKELENQIRKEMTKIVEGIIKT